MDARFIDLLPDLALFVAIGRADSLSAASRATGIPVARLSRRLLAMERAVGVRLVERTSRRFGLTVEGAAYLAALEPTLSAVSDAYGELALAGQSPTGTLRLTATADFGAVFLSNVISEFSTLHPGLSFEIDLTPQRVDIGAERFDAAIRVGPLIDSDLTSRRLATVPSEIYASAAYLKAHGTPQHPSELVRHRCLPLPHMADAAVFRRDGEVCEVAMRGPVKVNNLLMLRRLCGDGLGIAVMNSIIAAEGGAHCPIERVLPEWQLDPAVFYFLTPARILPARVRAFFDFARQRLAADGY